jgi:hypothetical protein
MSDESPLEPQLNTMLQLGYSLHSLGQKLDDSLIAITMIISLPDSDSTLRSVLMATDLKLTTESGRPPSYRRDYYERVPVLLLPYRCTFRRKGQKGQNKGKQAENKGEKDKGGNGKQCGYAACGLKGHTEDECRKLKAVLDKHGHLKQKDSKPLTSSITANMATTTIAPVNNYDDAICLFIARGEMRENPNDWVVDSGTTEYMCSSGNLLSHTDH